MQLSEKLLILRGIVSANTDYRPSPQKTEQEKRDKFEEIIASAKPIDETSNTNPFGYPI